MKSYAKSPNRLYAAGLAASTVWTLAACGSEAPKPPTPKPSVSASKPGPCMPMEMSEVTSQPGQTPASLQAARFAARLFTAINERCASGAADIPTVSTMGEITRLQLERDLPGIGSYVIGVMVKAGEDGKVQPDEIQSWDALQAPEDDDPTGLRIKIDAGRYFDDPSGLDWYYRQGEQAGPANTTGKSRAGTAHTQSGPKSTNPAAFATSDDMAYQMLQYATR